MNVCDTLASRLGLQPAELVCSTSLSVSLTQRPTLVPTVPPQPFAEPDGLTLGVHGRPGMHNAVMFVWFRGAAVSART